MAVSVAGVGVFAFPDPLHNLFGISELIGYQAPLVLALAHRKVAGAGVIIAFSLVMYVLVVAALVLNLASLDRSGDLWLAVKDVYGLAQRALFAAWFAWCAGVGLLMIRRRRSPPAAT